MGNIKTKHNRLTHTTSYYTFNARNQLTRYEQKDENNQTVKTLEFSYDAFGRRVSKTQNGITQKYLYDGDDIVAILDNDNNVIATLTHDESIDTPLSITNTNGTFYYHRDHQGSIIALTDSSGQVVERFTYDNHYGTVLSHTKTVETNNPYAYTGREFDTPELYYYRARYYDPTLQRFISEDPIGFASGDFNWYRYVGDDPVDWVDPWGEQYEVTKPEQHPGSKKHIHWGKKGNPRSGGAINIDGTIRHGKYPPKKVLKMIEKKYGWKLAKKTAGAICRKTPLVIPLFIYDWSTGGFGNAINEATWPVSILWNGE